MSSGCKCGSNCSCGDNCSCSRNLNVGYSEKTTTTETIISGVATVKMNFEGSSEMSLESGNGCKCGSNCKCDPCNC
ncbi:hypothetical protein PTKIN_Ptkin03bG0053500 [Pterospermum kingtungense]